MFRMSVLSNLQQQLRTRSWKGLMALSEWRNMNVPTRLCGGKVQR